MYRQFARAGAITDAELQSAPLNEEDFEHDSDEEAGDGMLNKRALEILLAMNTPFQTAIKLLLGLHSANIRTNKGSIYRIRFVAPGTPHDVPDPAMKSAAKTDTAPKASPTSAIYPLLAMPTLEFTGKRTNLRTVTNKLDAEFNKLVEAELDALEDLTVSGSSSITDTNWDDDYRRKSADSQMYTEQHMPKHMMFDYERSQKET